MPPTAARPCVPTTAFSIAPPSPNGSAGWYKGGAPIVTLTSTGGTSGVAATFYTVQGGPAQTYTGPFALPDGGSVVVTYWATDNAGNVEPTHTSATYKVDTVSPSVALTTPADGAIYRQGATVPADYSCADGTSGVASCAGTTADGGPLDTSTLGWHTFAVAAADAAGNAAAPVSHGYYVAPTSTSKPQSWGKVKLGPATTVRVGYDFSLPGKHPAAQVRFVQPQVELAVTCVSNGAASSLVVPMADDAQTVPANDTDWLPSGDRSRASSTRAASPCRPASAAAARRCSGRPASRPASSPTARSSSSTAGTSASTAPAAAGAERPASRRRCSRSARREQPVNEAA